MAECSSFSSIFIRHFGDFAYVCPQYELNSKNDYEDFELCENAVAVCIGNNCFLLWRRILYR